MMKFALPLLALVAAAPAFAQSDATPVAFERDGVHFQATQRSENGVTYINGREVESGKPFSLRVAKGRVSGTYGVSRVSYDAPVNR